MRHHGEGLLRELNDQGLVDAIIADYQASGLSDQDKTMLDYVAKLTEAPAEIVEGDIQPLRTAGFDDRAILDINQITGFFAWCNRTVDGLGVDLETFWDDPEQSNI